MSSIKDDKGLQVTLNQIKIIRASIEQQLDLLAEMQINVELFLDKEKNVNYNQFNDEWNSI